MRRRSQASAELCVCPMCRKVVDYGVVCCSCAAWFHATEACCGDRVCEALDYAGRTNTWCCLNCDPMQGVGVQPSALRPPASTIEIADWRRAFRVMTRACCGCGLRVASHEAAIRCSECHVHVHATETCARAPLDARAARRARARERASPHPARDASRARAPCRCTGLTAARLAECVADDAWKCATCMVRATTVASADGLVSADVTGGAEAEPIPLINEVDDEPLPPFEYLKQVVWRKPNVCEKRERLPRAEWGSKCIGAEACTYGPANDASEGRPVRKEKASAGGSAYNAEGCLLFARDNLFECNGSSGCDGSCFNRVVGRGVSAKLQVFKTVGRGWGVRATQPVPAGGFVCEYTGEMLLNDDAEVSGVEQDDSYLFNLDGEEKGKVSKRRRTAPPPSSIAAQTEENPAFCVDASRCGSVARFVNHCCEPNLFVQSVFVEYSRHVHRIALFAARDILPYEELTYDCARRPRPSPRHPRARTALTRHALLARRRLRPRLSPGEDAQMPLRRRLVPRQPVLACAGLILAGEGHAVLLHIRGAAQRH